MNPMRRILSVSACCAAMLVAGCRDTQGPDRPPVLLIGIDGMEWNVMLPMLERGELPSLAALMKRGTFGTLGTSKPTQSPIIWTSIATGKTMDEHGIRSFVKMPMRAGDPLTLFDNRDRKTKAIWNIAGDYDRRVAVVGWWMTFPVESVNGVMIAQTNTTEQLDVWQGKNIWKGRLVPGTEGQVYPPERASEIMELLAEVDGSLDDLVEEIFGGFEHPLSLLGERLWSNCLWALRADATYLRIVDSLLEERDPYDLTAVYLGGPDVVAHRFWRYYQPELYLHRPTPKQIENFGRLIEDYYAYIDAAIGRIVEKAGPHTRVILIADHGMGPINRNQSFSSVAPPKDVNSANHLDAPAGVLIAAGPDLQKGESPIPTALLQRSDLRKTGTIYDVAPTVLTLMEVPVGEDMRGEPMTTVLKAEFLESHPVRTVATHDTKEWVAARAELVGIDKGAQERIDQLRALGYVDEEKN
jgi:predicted AlkP superfamily pyrophosphatase or phosphodiesterase